MRIGGVLLAAGLGSRFDPTGHNDKLLAPWQDGQPVLWHSASTLAACVDEAVAVIRPEQTQRREWLERLGITVVASSTAQCGMGAALSAGLSALAKVEGVLVCLGDMPAIRPDTFRQVRAAITDPRTIAVPRFNGLQGHPVGFGAHWFHELKSLTGDQGPRHLLKREPVTWLDIGDPGCRLDIDLPADLSSHTIELNPRHA